ncbi:MAG: hypothetical protein H0U95_01425 [Bacteroidetes bacterium]|nr:hypothetical protein [Bacteroidota bacterium]
MKKIISVSLLLLFGVNTIRSQEGIATKGNNIVNVYYGVNILTSVFKTAVTNAYSTDVSVKSAGPFGIVYEHLVVDKIGLGAEIGYGSTTVSFKNVETNYNSTTGTTSTNSYDYTYKFATIRAMFRANFHFTNSENFDAYGFVSAGYRGTTFSFTSNDPYAIKANYTGIPFGLKPGVGLRYFFIPAMGLNLEMAIGTPLISGGLSFKF